jgi:hypothetical protein
MLTSAMRHGPFVSRAEHEHKRLYQRERRELAPAPLVSKHGEEDGRLRRDGEHFGERADDPRERVPTRVAGREVLES